MKWAIKFIFIFLACISYLEARGACQKVVSQEELSMRKVQGVRYKDPQSGLLKQDNDEISHRKGLKSENLLTSASKKKVTFIVNPISGTGKQKRIEKEIRRNLNLKEFDYEILYTKCPHHGTELSAQAAKKGSQIIVAVGGDGSVNEVAQGMIGSSSALAIIPTGSGNGFARHFEIPTDTAKAIEVINGMNEKWIDTVKMNDKSYLGVAGIGFDADVSRAFASLDIRGPASYLFVVLSELPLYKPQDYDLVIDGKPLHKKAFLICFANTNQYGNNAFIAPNAKIDDGFLDVIIWKEFPPHAAPKLVHDLFNKSLGDSVYTETYRCQEVILKRPLHTLHMDGEPMEAKGDVYIRILPSSLKIITPS